MSLSPVLSESGGMLNPMLLPFQILLLTSRKREDLSRSAVYKDMIQNLNLPPFEPKISSQDGKTFIWDPIRKIWTALTPEEQVRQAFVSYLINYKGFPASHIANEQAIELNGMSRRCDSVIYDKSGAPKLQ